ncbi:hypothetical protein AOCH_003473 [Aspergillus ochraceoroseus]|uniref:protein disulfide-isomerase n=1 Tax=Aspergillus ochraceoroseus TaxID=138278 RepID=A0A0F8XNW2_9EURO|nr:hypothetical protein AOCH_003473 [Aspergillus ochraceoroseus]
MWQPSSAFLLVASLLAALPVNADGLYTKKSPVLQVNQKDYAQLIAHSNYTSIVEFYAPWCGHCKNLKPAYEKAAKNLEGLAKVAAVNCDEDANKPFCGQMGAPCRRLPGPRTAKGIVDAVVDKIPNHVARVTDKGLDEWLSKDEELPKAILFTEKGTTSALIRAVAIEFLGGLKVAQIRSKESSAVEKFGITGFPALVLLPGGEKEAIIYDGELKKGPIVEFLSQAATRNPDPAPAKAKPKSKASSSSSSSSSSTNKPTDKPAPDNEESKSTAPTSTPAPPAPPPEIPILSTAEALEVACLGPKSGTCVLALLPEAEEPSPNSEETLKSLAEIADKHAKRHANLFPIYNIPAANSGAKTLRTTLLGLSEDAQGVEVIALNARRGWWRRYDPSESADYSAVRVEAWIDAIRLGEGSKNKLPDGVVVVKEEEEEAADHDEL